MTEALVPLFMVFPVHDELRLAAMGYMKQIVTYALQGVLLILLFGLTPILAASDYLSFESLEGGILAGAGAIIINVMTYFNLILKYVAVIIPPVNLQGFAKRLVGVM